eukprot:TRINITY_DN5520_c0_g2_i1.p1 TRINITY_DN5520_c0_g2~~TRINITY_DN5520_c0_g2_i1.p1  ORF type:complete len:128 (-),score=29.92 TRINITY_DN5520_c0_g2_i1:32-415(-)
MPYSLSTKFIAELLSMTVYIAIGNGCTANEVLPRTKGNSLGMGFVAIAYGLAFFIATAMFGHISTVPNPAFVFAQARGASGSARGCGGGARTRGAQGSWAPGALRASNQAPRLLMADQWEAAAVADQ